MDLYKEILVKVLEKEKGKVEISGLELDVAKIVEQKCYQTLLKIKGILSDPRLDDTQCFQKIEAIILTLESIGSGCDFRHDIRYMP